ncbi:MAG: hypothetical protein KF886_23500 [Candidatus Hydrogenedentes bacterium]|nr:hypothetical protein [Candidatus Hydrogenedentota bacterium]
MIQPDWSDPGLAQSYLADVILKDFDSVKSLRFFVADQEECLSKHLRLFLLTIADDEEAAESKAVSPPPLNKEAEEKFLADMDRLIEIRNARARRASQPQIPMVMGTLWSPWPIDNRKVVPIPDGYLILATPGEEDELVQVVPVAYCPELATLDDFLLGDRPHHLAGFAAMGMEHPVPRSLLMKGVGFLEEDELEALVHWRYASYGAAHNADTIASFTGSISVDDGAVVRMYQEYVQICDTPYRDAAIKLMSGGIRDTEMTEEPNVVDARALWSEHQGLKKGDNDGSWPVETEGGEPAVTQQLSRPEKSLRLAASSGGIAETIELKDGGHVDVTLDGDGVGRISVFAESPRTSISVVFECVAPSQRLTIECDDGSISESIQLRGAVDVAIRIVDSPAIEYSAQTVKVLIIEQ